jgi:hypothetical protein
MPPKKISAADRRHADFMIKTLGPDLRRDNPFTAADVMRCGRLMKAGKRNAKFANWLKTTLVPDLRASGRNYTANDLARCARAISTSPKRKRSR